MMTQTLKKIKNFFKKKFLEWNENNNTTIKDSVSQ